MATACDAMTRVQWRVHVMSCSYIKQDNTPGGLAQCV